MSTQQQNVTRALEALEELLNALDANGSCQYEALREEAREALEQARGDA
ncbi:hypothetical protein [Vreelandella aquamarina]|jgi:ElaB/YqjD/DUF883 family membrane-anchored ribosome-binding protein|nr:hypothetical protein [Halomonas meridiana]